MATHRLSLFFTILGSALLATSFSAKASEEVNLYSHRHYEVDKEIFEEFTKQTGIKVNVVQASADQLIERLKAEGENSPADLLLTVDAGRLQRAKEADLLQPASSEALDTAVPEDFRDPDKQWYGVTVRARVIVYPKKRLKTDDFSTYEDLADAKWKGRVLASSSGSVYNQSLVASLIGANGQEKAQEWAANFVKNMARAPQGGDRDQARAVAAGLADAALVNTYYIGLLRTSKDPKDVEVGEAVEVFFPNQEGRGAHINVSGIGLTRSAKNKENAIKFMEYLVSPDVQSRFATANHEYPLSLDIEASPVLKAFGPFKADRNSVQKLGTLNTEAVEVLNKAAWP